MSGGRLGALILLLLAAALPVHAGTPGVRGDLRFTASFLDYRTVVRDSLPEGEVPGDGTTRELPDGTPVTCIPGLYCYWFRAGEERTTTPLTQDLRLTGWTGWRGVSGRAHLRGRFGSDSFWPRSKQRIEAVDLYLDFDREEFRLRGGRQSHGGGLGVWPFDGGSALWRASRSMHFEIWAGRSLGGTLGQSYTGSLLADVDDLAPDVGAVLIGGEAWFRPVPSLAGTLIYQRELRTDRLGLYSERMSLDGRWQPGKSAVDFSAEFDVAAAEFNELHLTARKPVARGVDLAIEGRHSRPWFSLWTIWGAFSPVGFDEARLSGAWAISPLVRLDASAAWRDYRDTDTGPEFAPIEGDGLSLSGTGSWTPAGWSASMTGRLQSGFGAYRGSLDLWLERRLGPRSAVGLYGVGTQQFTEFRFGDGRSHGLGINGRWGRGHVDLEGRVALFRHGYRNRPGYPDWDQLRGSLGLVIGFGSEPTAPSRTAGGWARS